MLSIWVRGKSGSQQVEHVKGPIEFGRGPAVGGIPRTVINDPTISTNQARIEPNPDGTLLIHNLSTKVPIDLADGSRIVPGASMVARAPLRLHVGERIIEIHAKTADTPPESATLRSIAAPINPRAWGLSNNATVLLRDRDRDPNPADLPRWFEALVTCQRAAASSPDFFGEVARAVVELIGLDRGIVLLHGGENWVPVAAYALGGPADESDYSHAILERVRKEKLTFFQQDMPTSSSLEGVSAVVAAPIIDDHQRVVGAVYGARDQGHAHNDIRPLEAQLTQVLAATVAAGLARLESEATAARNRVQFEQFFTADLAAELDRDPALLEGREREITALFADIRGFSAVSERIPPRVACDLIRDIMELLTHQVREQGGVVVDYQGDGLLAMWNAPIDQPDHAARACLAALALREKLPQLNLRWRDRIGRDLGIGIGINTGPALVGNTGSRIKFKYGPLGHTVNLASRVEGATKQLGVGTLITGTTHAQIGDRFATRRVCKVRVVGIEGEVELHELHALQAEPAWQVQRDAYEEALNLYENRRWGEACHILFPLLPAHHDAPGAAYDTPTVTLLARALECVKNPPDPFDPAMKLTSK